MIKYFFIVFLILVSFCCLFVNCSFSNHNKTKQIIDPNNAFSITIPSAWKSEKSKNGDYSEVVISSKGKFNISLYLTSRLLSPQEKEISTIQLIDNMVNSSIDKLKNKKSSIINVGKAKEFVINCPAFVIISISKDNKLVTSWGTIVNDRNYSIIAITDNIQANEDLADLLKSIIESIKINP